MNKKLILSAAAVAAIGAASFAAFNSNTPTREFSDLELANIEALTDDEYDDPDCPSGWSIECHRWFDENKNTTHIYFKANK